MSTSDPARVAGRYLRSWSHEGRSGYSFYCPACEGGHTISTDNGGKPCWVFDGDFEKPSFTPSVKLERGGKIFCHLFVTKGEIIFCNDFQHELAGKTVPLPEWPSDYGW